MNLDSTQTRITNKQNCMPFPERILPQNSNHHHHQKTDVYPLTFSNNTRKSIRNDYTTQSHCFTNPKAVPLPQTFGNTINQSIIGSYNNTNMVNTNVNNSNHISHNNFQNDRNNDITNCYNLKQNPMNDRMLPIDTRHTFKPQD